MPVCPDTDIAYDRAGPTGGTPVLLVHAGVADRRMWEPQWAALTRRHDVVRLDLRGFGESASRPAAVPFAHHDDVADTLAALGVERAHLVGCSFGAGVAVETALEHPELVASLLLAAPGGSLMTEMSPELRRFFDAEREAMDRGDLDAAVQANLDWWVDGPQREADPARTGIRDLVATMQRRAFEVTADWDDVEEVELDPPTAERLSELAVPTLVLEGGLDIPTICVAARDVAGQVSGARREVWTDTAHLPSLERPEDFRALLEEWLAEVSRS
ncbi:MAG: alpha/beta fold hydrolase [Oryzihumus sp.]